MPKTAPGLFRHLPAGLLNALFPVVRLLHGLFYLLVHTLGRPFRSGAVLPAPLAKGRVLSVCSSWEGGVPKFPKASVFISPLGILGDRQKSGWVASFGGHGGLDKAGAHLVTLHSENVLAHSIIAPAAGCPLPAACLRTHSLPIIVVCLFDAAVMERLVREGHKLFPGAIGENVVLADLPWKQLIAPGCRLRLGCTVLLEISEVTAPCGTIKGAFTKARCPLPRRVGQAAAHTPAPLNRLRAPGCAHLQGQNSLVRAVGTGPPPPPC